MNGLYIMELTIVSGYWQVVNKHNNQFQDWFDKTLKINCPYVFFGNEESINMVKQHRKNLPTHYIKCEITDFYTYKYIDHIQTHDIHCPSKELNLIWNEKLFLMKQAAELNVFNSQYFAWVDAGICIFRDDMPPDSPFPNDEKLNELPHNKFVFTSSTEMCDATLVSQYVYYHHVSAGVFILHKSFVNTFVDVYYKKFIDKLLPRENWIYTEQVILTNMFKVFPNLFHKMTHGWGNIIPLLY